MHLKYKYNYFFKCCFKSCLSTLMGLTCIIITIFRTALCPYPGVTVCAVKLEGDLHSALGFGDGIMTLRQCDCPATSAYRV